MLKNKIKEFKEVNKLTDAQCAKKLEITEDELNRLEQGEQVTKEEENKILDIIERSKGSSGKKATKILDLIFRFVAMVMALVTLLLCINENVDTKVLVVLLSIGLVCSSMTILPKIEK